MALVAFAFHSEWPQPNLQAVSEAYDSHGNHSGHRLVVVHLLYQEMVVASCRRNVLRW